MQNCYALSFLWGGDEERPWTYQILEGIEELMKRADLFRGVISWNHKAGQTMKVHSHFFPEGQ